MLILLFYKQEFSFLEIKINRIFIFGWETILIDAAKMPITLKKETQNIYTLKEKVGRLGYLLSKSSIWRSKLGISHCRG